MKITVFIKNNINNIKNSLYFKNIFNYFSADMFVKGSAAITIPIFTRLLTTEQYGLYNLFNSSIQIGIPVLGLGISIGISRYFFEPCDDFNKALGSNLIFISLFMLLMSAIAVFFTFLFHFDFNFIIFILIASVFGVYYDIYQKYLIGSKNSKTFRNSSMVYSILFYGGSTCLLFILSDKYFGVVFAKVFAYICLGLFSVYYLLKLSKLSYSNKYVSYTLKYSIPYMPALVSNLVLAQIDRYIIQGITHNTSQVGIYSLAYNIGMVLNLFIGAIANSWKPFLYDKLNKCDYDGIRQLIKKNAKVVFFATLVFYFYSYEIILIMADKKYYDAFTITPVILISYIFYFIYTVYLQFTAFVKKTIFISINNSVAGAVNIILNILLIPKFGYKIAAYTTLFSYFLLSVLHYITVNILYKSDSVKFTLFADIAIFLILGLGAFSLITHFIPVYFVQFILKNVILIVTAMYFFLSGRLSKLYKKKQEKLIK